MKTNCQCPPGKCLLYNLVGRSADICAGKALMADGSPMPEKSISQYRSNWQRIKEQGLVRSLVTFVTAEARWMAAGCPTRTPTTIKEIYAICEACPNFKANGENKGVCTVCNCKLAKFPEVINKIKMETENCPEGKW